MKIKIVFSSIVLGLFLFQSCTQDPDLKFNLKDRIYFEYGIQEYNDFVKFDSITFSFGRLDDSIRIDTARIVMKYLGNESDYDKQYRVKVVQEGQYVEGQTNAVEGVHYEALDEYYTFKGDRFTDTLKIVLHRDSLDASYITQEKRMMILKLEESDDFDLGINDGLEMKLSINNFLSPPDWWDKRVNALDYYHPKKWIILISFDEMFSDPAAASLDGISGNIMNMHAESLRLYLENNIVIDEETGKRVKMDKLESI